jgi:hypothetical protein
LFLILPINWEGDKMRGQNEDTAAGEKFEPPSDPEHLFTWVRKQVTLHPSTEREITMLASSRERPTAQFQLPSILGQSPSREKRRYIYTY